MNRVYSILMRGTDPGAVDYYRRVDPTVQSSRYPSLSEELVSSTWDMGYQAFAADQLVQICRHSLLAEALQVFDPMNTYEYEFPGTERGTTISALPAGISFELVEPTYGHLWVRARRTVRIDPAGIASVNGVDVPFTSQDNLTSPIALAAGLDLRVRGVLPAAFTAVVDAVRTPARDLASLVNQLHDSNIQWLPAYRDHRSDLAVNDWLATFILNYCESVDGA